MRSARRIWVDLANAPHVLVCAPIIEHLRAEGWDVVLTARDHAQTLELAHSRWGEVAVLGGPSPSARAAKGAAILQRASKLRAFARRVRPDVAFSHGSYAQIVAARIAGIPAVTMMDYEHQPANHLSFRLARKVIVPRVFPDAALRRFGVAPAKVIRYEGFKEELYLGGLEPDESVLREFAIEPGSVVAVLRTPPDGALYHRGVTGRFGAILSEAVRREGVTAVLIPRDAEQRKRYSNMPGVLVPSAALDGPSLLASADVVIGGGGTMTRESALLGTPTYTVFAGRPSAVDAELIRLGKLHDLRAPGSVPNFAKRAGPRRGVDAVRASNLLDVVVSGIRSAAA